MKMDMFFIKESDREHAFAIVNAISVFSMISLMSPDDSWVSKWQRIGTQLLAVFSHDDQA